MNQLELSQIGANYATIVQAVWGVATLVVAALTLKVLKIQVGLKKCAR